MLKRPAIKQPFKVALAPILGLVFKIRILNFFISLCYGYFWLCYEDIKTFIFKNGLFGFVILKL
ncbi:hypothetical protein ACQJ9R_07405, partial [Helicobacter pylori]